MVIHKVVACAFSGAVQLSDMVKRKAFFDQPFSRNFGFVFGVELAELCEQYLEKGIKVAIEGKLVHRTYENKEGEKRYVTEVHCDELLLL